MPRIQDAPWEPPLAKPGRNRELVRHIRSEVGIVSPDIGYFADCPWIPRIEATFVWHVGGLVLIDAALAEKVSFVVSQENSCRYCFAFNRIMLRFSGMPDERIRRLEEDSLARTDDAKERAALDFARRLTRANPLLTATDARALRAAGYTTEAIREIATVAAVHGVMNRAVTMLAIPPTSPERAQTNPVARIVVNLLLRRWRGRWRSGEPVFLPAAEQDGPFAYLVRALNGLPAGRNMRRALDDAWSAPHLPPRTKALIVAVVGRALGCDLSEDEAVRLLESEGLTRDDVNDVLAHLASPKLDPTEALIVPFARETVWYQPAPIQRRVRALQTHLTIPQIQEAIGICAVANMLCRLGCIVDMSEW